jgi:hypothetical protein
MAKLNGPFSFTGRLGKLSAYRMKGLDETILRTPGGASKEKIETDPAFEKTRRINVEFGGCGKGSKYLRKALFPLYQLSNYSFTGRLIKMIRTLLVLDTTSEFGKRHIHFSKNPKLFEGFHLDDKNTFDSIVRNPLSYSMNKNQLNAEIQFPELLPGINFYVPPGYPAAYSFVATLGIVPDLVYRNSTYTPLFTPEFGTTQSAWYPVIEGSSAISLSPAVSTISPVQPPAAPFTLMLSVGIRFGTIGFNNQITQVPKTGAAKIVGME